MGAEFNAANPYFIPPLLANANGNEGSHLTRIYPLFPASPIDKSFESIWEPHPIGHPGQKIYSDVVRHLGYYQDLINTATEIRHDHEISADIYKHADPYVIMATYMDFTSRYDDHDNALRVMHRYIDQCGGGALSTSVLPDTSVYIHYLRYWGKHVFAGSPDREVWCNVLGIALPNAGRARTITTTFDRLLGGPVVKLVKTVPYDARLAVYDFLLAILPASLLGIYPTCKFRLPMRTRMLVYLAFSLCPPSIDDLNAFVTRNKWFVNYAIREYLVYSIAGVPGVRRYLDEVYTWGNIEEETTYCMDKIRRVLADQIHGPDFLYDRVMWTSVQNALFERHRISVKHCYRAASELFSTRMLREYRSLGTANPKYRPEMRLTDVFDTYKYAAQFRVHYGATLGYAISDLRHWRGLDATVTDKLTKARIAFENETKLTSGGHALKWLFNYDQKQYHKYYAFLRACEWRMAIWYRPLPWEWTERQIKALQKHFGNTDGELEKDAGVYFYCPVCMDMRCHPVTAPAGSDPKVRTTSYYPTGVAYEIVRNTGEGRLICNAKNIRNHDRVIRHKARNKLNSGLELKETDKCVDACHDTPLIRVCLIGTVVFTKNSRGVTLCVHCGTTVRWTESALTPLGPNCGCYKSERAMGNVYSSCMHCGKEHKTRHMRVHKIITEDGIIDAAFCKVHRTKWIEKLAVVPTWSFVRNAMSGSMQRVEMTGGDMTLVERDITGMKKQRKQNR